VGGGQSFDQHGEAVLECAHDGRVLDRAVGALKDVAVNDLGGCRAGGASHQVDVAGESVVHDRALLLVERARGGRGFV
jgi:hypothetical protein